MSVRARQAVAVICLAVALVVELRLQAGSALPSQPDPFHADVTVTAQPVPDIYADRPDVRVLQLLDSMNASWKAAFAAAGDPYAPPIVETRTRRAAEGCGAEQEGWAGYYCSAGTRIVIDLGHQDVGRAMLGDDQADDLLAHVLAHEVGHHVQALRGHLRKKTPAATRRVELHAQCLAGVYGAASGRPLPPVWSYAEDAEHGTVAEQQHWVGVGHARARPADCERIWSS
jgi:predicted metalloprotease